MTHLSCFPKKKIGLYKVDIFYGQEIILHA